MKELKKQIEDLANNFISVNISMNGNAFTSFLNIERSFKFTRNGARFRTRGTYFFCSTHVPKASTKTFNTSTPTLQETINPRDIKDVGKW